MTIDLDVLEGLAKAAMQGEDWSSRPVERLADAEFIAAASPAVVTRLIAAARERDGLRARGLELSNALARYGFPVSGGAKASLADHGSNEARALDEAARRFRQALNAGEPT